MPGVGREFLVAFHQFAVIVVYFLPHPGGFLKLRLRTEYDFLEKNLPAPDRARAFQPIASAVFGQIFPIMPVALVLLSSFGHYLLPLNVFTTSTTRWT